MSNKCPRGCGGRMNDWHSHASDCPEINMYETKSIISRIRVPKGKLVAKRDEGKKITEGGIHLPDPAVKAKNTGEIILVGEMETLVADPGDTVVFGNYPMEMEIEDEKFLILEEKEVLLVLRDDTKEESRD